MKTKIEDRIIEGGMEMIEVANYMEREGYRKWKEVYAIGKMHNLSEEEIKARATKYYKYWISYPSMSEAEALERAANAVLESYKEKKPK